MPSPQPCPFLRPAVGPQLLYQVEFCVVGRGSECHRPEGEAGWLSLQSHLVPTVQVLARDLGKSYACSHHRYTSKALLAPAMYSSVYSSSSDLLSYARRQTLLLFPILKMTLRPEEVLLLVQVISLLIKEAEPRADTCGFVLFFLKFFF